MDQKAIGKYIALLRRKNNMTQEQLAESLGVTNKSVSRWENGQSLPDISVLLELSEILNTTLLELIKGRNLNKEELLKQKELIENIIAYDNNTLENRIKKYEIKLVIGIFIIAVAIFNNYYNFLSMIFTPNVADFVQGYMYGVGIGLELICVYNLSHNFSLEERKKKLLKKKHHKKK